MKNKWANTNFHVPVLKDAVISSLCVKPNGIYLDGTLGFGGHTKLIMKKFSDQGGKVLGFDGDIDAIKFCKKNLNFNAIIHPAIGFTNENMSLYLATDLVQTNINRDSDEFLELMPTSLEHALDLVWSNKITDVKTIIGILWYQKIYQESK